jgi:hypothetical protein
LVTVAVFMSGVVSVILRSAVFGGPTRTGRGRWWARRRGQGVAALMLGFAAGPALAHEDAVLEVFTRAGCPRCELAGRFLAGLQADRPGLQIESRRVDEDPAALARLRTLCEQAGVATPGVPAFRVGRHLVVGFADEATTGARLKFLLAGETAAPGVDEVCPAEAGAECVVPLDTADGVQTRLFGALSVQRLGLPAFTVALGLLDGFNPCAMWVLLLLLSLLVNLHDRRRMALIAATFVAVSGLMYFAFMAAWLNVFLLIGVSRTAQVVLGLVALVVGGLNVKDAVAFGWGPSLVIPAGAKPGIYARARRLLSVESLAPALAGVVILAVLVNLVELLCTAGFPAVYTAILAGQPLSRSAHYGYLALYNLAYIADDALMVALAVATLGRHKLAEREDRWMKLVSGVVMLALGGALVLAPGLLVV